MSGNPTLPKDSHDGRPGHNATVLGGGDSEKCPLLCFLGIPGCHGAGLATQESITLKQDYPTIWPLPCAPTHHTQTCSCILTTTWCLSSKDSRTTLLRLSSHENHELNKSLAFKSLCLGYFVIARKKNERRH